MAIKDALIAEFKHESASTKKILERVPMERSDWKPHEKSMTLGKLATHIAGIPHWASDIAEKDEFDFRTDIKPEAASTNEELMKLFQDRMDKALAGLDKMGDEDFKKMWVAKSGDQVYYNMPKVIALRGFAFNHLLHHRGQLSVYLRLLDIPVPGMYGPSADEQM